MCRVYSIFPPPLSTFSKKAWVTFVSSGNTCTGPDEPRSIETVDASVVSRDVASSNWGRMTLLSVAWGRKMRLSWMWKHKRGSQRRVCGREMTRASGGLRRYFCLYSTCILYLRRQRRRMKTDKTPVLCVIVHDCRTQTSPPPCPGCPVSDEVGWKRKQRGGWNKEKWVTHTNTNVFAYLSFVIHHPEAISWHPQYCFDCLFPTLEKNRKSKMNYWAYFSTGINNKPLAYKATCTTTHSYVKWWWHPHSRWGSGG